MSFVSDHREEDRRKKSPSYAFIQDAGAKEFGSAGKQKYMSSPTVSLQLVNRVLSVSSRLVALISCQCLKPAREHFMFSFSSSGLSRR